MTFEQLEKELLKLPAADRARLARRLLSSLEGEPGLDEEWKAEARRRDEELESGAVEALPLEEVLESVKSQYGW